MADIVTKDDLLGKLRAYATTVDDENIQYKDIIKKTLLKCPELLYALHEKDLEDELFDDDGNINWDSETHEPLGEWDRYFGEFSNIRPYLFIPETQTTVKHYVCYQVGFDELPRYNKVQKYTEITFTIFVDGKDAIDVRTGISRSDLIGSILRERFNLRNTFGMQARLISSKESTTDNNYIVRTMVFQIVDLNGLAYTPYDSKNNKSGKTSLVNHQLRK
jgi:hypothetical protein